MADLPATKAIRLERRGFRLIATIDDPATRNAMTDELVADLFALLDATKDDRSIRVLVLQGANGAFCAGANLKSNLERLEADLKLDETDPLFTANRRGGELYARARGASTTRSDIDESFLAPEVIPKPGVEYFDNHDWEYTVTKKEEARKHVREILQPR